MKVRCPHCGAATEYTPENKFRPFCSERCSLIDLGAWAEEKYRVPVQSVADIDAEQGESRERDEKKGPSDQGQTH